MEVRFLSTQLRQISLWMNETNSEVEGSVRIGGILLDSEQFLINFGNATQVTALKRKDDLIYNASREYCFPPLCTVEQYNRGTIAREATLAKPDEGIPPDDAWTPWVSGPGAAGTAAQAASAAQAAAAATAVHRALLLSCCCCYISITGWGCHSSYCLPFLS